MPKYLEPSFEIIEKLETKNDYICKSKYPKVEFSIELSKSDDEFAFIGYIESKLRNNKWDLKEVILKGMNQKLLTNKITITRTEPLNVTNQKGEIFDKIYGNINYLTYNKKINNKLYRRVIIPVDENVKFSNYIISKSFQTEKNITFGRAFIEIKIDKNTFDFFLYKRNQKNFLIIDSLDKISFNAFFKYVYAIILGYGFITGNMPYGQAYYLSSGNKNFKSLKNLLFRTLQDSIKSPYSIIYANSYAYNGRISKNTADYFYKKLNEIDKVTFSNICSNIYKNEPILRSIVLILMANTFEIFTASAIYNVVLETLSKYFGEVKADDIKPIQNKTTWRGLRKKFIEAMDEIKADIGDDIYNYLINKKINNLNSPGNRDMLSIQFSINGINLSEEEEKIIDLRNTFLHGGHPIALLQKDYNTDRFGLLYYILLRLHFMINRLLLRHFGYRGYMVNYVKLNQKITKIKVTDDPFIKV